MVSLAKANLLHEKSKVILSIGGVVLGVFLLFTTTGLYYGINSVVEDMVLKGGADLWITSPGASGSIHSPSLLPIDLEGDIRDIDGVEKVTPLVRMPVAIELNGEKTLIYLNGYDIASGLGGPWLIAEGLSEPGSGEIIIDKALAKKNDLSIGQNIDIEGRHFDIVGISDDTFIMIASMTFITLDDALSFLPNDLTNFFLVKVNSTEEIADVKKRIENALPAVQVSTSEVNASQAKEETVGGFLPIIFIISAIGVLVGVLVVGLLVYTMTIEKSKEYGIARAIGATNLYLYKIVLFQSMAISLVGFVIGTLVSYPLISLIRYLVPEFVVLITPQMILWAFLLFLGTGLVASVIPVRRLVGIDPATVFKER